MNSFRSACLEAHWAAQPLAAMGNLLLPHQEDYSHTSLVWSEPQRALLLQRADAPPRPFQAGLRIEGLTLIFLAGDGQLFQSFPLSGRTLTEAYAFCQQAVQSLAGVRQPLTPPKEGPSPHATNEGAPFDATAESLAEVSALFSTANATLQRVRSAHHAREPVRCWPHHFDLATLIERAGQPTIGAGMQPGDSTYETPYYYVNIGSAPDPSALKPLRRGFWHTEGWTGAVFLANQGDADGAAQFVEEAITILAASSS